MSDELPKWIRQLDERDLKFVERFILASGSLKELAKEYKVTYPTIRIRLNQLIEKVKLSLEQKGADDFKLQLQRYVIEGEINKHVAKSLLEKHNKELKRRS